MKNRGRLTTGRFIEGFYTPSGVIRRRTFSAHFRLRSRPRKDQTVLHSPIEIQAQQRNEMPAGVPNFYGSRLAEARLSRGLFRNALADMIGVTPMAITRYESGLDKPRPDRVAAMAQKLNFPFDFFIHPPFTAEMGPVFWRNWSSDTKMAREGAEQRMKWLCQVFEAFEEELEFPKVDVPEVDLPADFSLLTPALIERSAQTIREAWGFRDQPIPDVILAIESAGIPVVSLEIQSDKQNGFFFYSNALARPFIGINSLELSACRARFDAAHQFGHLVLHSNVTEKQQRDKDNHRIIEEHANLFACAILFPKGSFLSEVSSPNLDYFCALKKRWGMPIAAMIMRASHLELIDHTAEVELHRSMGRRKWRGAMREPFDDPTQMPLEQPRMLQKGCLALLDSGIFQRGTLRSSLRLPDHELEQIVGLPLGYLSQPAQSSSAINFKNQDFESVHLETGALPVVSPDAA